VTATLEKNPPGFPHDCSGFYLSAFVFKGYCHGHDGQEGGVFTNPSLVVLLLPLYINGFREGRERGANQELRILWRF